MTLSVSPPMKKLLMWGSTDVSTGVPFTSVVMAKAVKLVTLPPIRMSPIFPMAAAPSETTYVPPGWFEVGLGAAGAALKNCVGTAVGVLVVVLAGVVLPSISLAWNRL